METVDLTGALAHMDAIARDEYGTTFAEAIDTADTALQMRRIARMAGIELKRPFAEPQHIVGPSETGARQQWVFKSALKTGSPGSVHTLNQLQGNPAYEFELAVFRELVARGHYNQNMSFVDFLAASHSESNWFFRVLQALQPYLCEPAKGTAEPRDRASKRQHFWDVVRSFGNAGIDKGIEASVAVVAVSLKGLVPMVALAPQAFVFTLCVFITHYAKKGYCTANFQDQVLSILSHSLTYENH